jgi:GTP cyclohydrolase IA
MVFIMGDLTIRLPFTMKYESFRDALLRDLADDLGDAHFSGTPQTPLREGAFELSEDEKILGIQTHFAAIMDILGLDLSDDSLQDTPKRVAKMFVKEIFWGLNPANQPEVSLFENTFDYQRMLVEKNITLKSTCEHHFLPIEGVAHVGYVSSGKVIGLSKLNRIVDYYARRPQVQERLTRQICQALQTILDTKDVIVVIDARHLCVSHRGIQHDQCSTATLEYGGVFQDKATRAEFLELIK